LSLAHVGEDALVCSEGLERIAQIKADINPLRHGRAGLREMPQRRERLLKAGHGLAVRGTVASLRPGLAAVGQGLVPDLPLQGMVG
jgi:hypothetical protein